MTHSPDVDHVLVIPLLSHCGNTCIQAQELSLVAYTPPTRERIRLITPLTHWAVGLLGTQQGYACTYLTIAF